MTRQRKNAEERQAEIVQTALELVGESGAKDVTAQAIADRVGISQPAVFKHFPTRDAIFRAALKFVSGQVFKLLESAGSENGRADIRLQNLLKRQLNLISRNRGLPRLLFSDRLHLEDPSLKETVRAVMDRYIAHLETIIESGKQDGSFRQDLVARDTARMIAATVQGLLIRWSIYDFEFSLPEQAPQLWHFVDAALKDRGNQERDS